MNKIEIIISKDSEKNRITVENYDFVIENENQFVYANSYKKYEVFEKVYSKYNSNSALENIYHLEFNYSWWQEIRVGIYTNKPIEKVIPKLKASLKKYIKDKYCWLYEYNEIVDNLEIENNKYDS